MNPTQLERIKIEIKHRFYGINKMEGPKCDNQRFHGLSGKM
jgi:hypothetical protein